MNKILNIYCFDLDSHTSFAEFQSLPSFQSFTFARVQVIYRLWVVRPSFTDSIIYPGVLHYQFVHSYDKRMCKVVLKR